MRAEQVPKALAEAPCPEGISPAAVAGGPLHERRVAFISTAGLMHAGDRPFSLGSADYRVIDTEDPRPLQMSHISTNFDRSGFAQDLGVVFPLDVLQELADDGRIASVARFHYAFMGATEPERMEPAARDLATVLAGDGVDLVCLIPV